jgi:preprotein translocase SecF subunit
MKIRWVGFVVTAIILVGTTVSLATQGLNLGLDFTGGVQIEADSPSGTPIVPEQVRARLAEAGFEESNVTTTQGGTTVVIRVPIKEGLSVEEVSSQAKAAMGAELRELKTDNVEGRVSDKLLMQGILASILAVLGIGAYVWFRFEVKFGTGAFVTTFHDVYAVLGLFSITQMTFDLTIVAGVLTVAGYSINDTVVVYDRIREMLKKYKKLAIAEVIDISITSTLSRTTDHLAGDRAGGDGDGVPGRTGPVWLRYLDHLRYRHRHLLFDLRGCPDADPPSGPPAGREVPEPRRHRSSADSRKLLTHVCERAGGVRRLSPITVLYARRRHPPQCGDAHRGGG